MHYIAACGQAQRINAYAGAMRRPCPGEDPYTMNTGLLTPAQVIDFWFAGDVEDAAAMDLRMQVLFTVDPVFDTLVRDHCGTTVERALGGELDTWADDARGTLALLILLDQMPRNIFRGSARAFAGDAQARVHAAAGFARGFDRDLAIIERVFLHLPLEHAEDLTLQERCVAGYEALHAEAPTALRKLTAAALQAGREHQAVIARFGRFPHRNALLGRPSTPDETAWLAVNRRAWGQGVDDIPR
jgi:uncharacterized protein (DUF924 family)